MITFEYMSAILVLPNPQYPNTNTVNVKTSFDHTMDGQMVSYKYTPAADDFLISVKGLTKNKKDEAYEFIRLNAACLIKYTDEESVEFNGYIKPEDIVIEEDGEAYTLEFTFRVKERL